MKSIFWTMPGLEFKAIRLVFCRYFRRFKKDFDDLCSSAYVSILEHSDVINSYNSEQQKLYKMISYARTSMGEFLSNSSKQNFYSIDMALKDGDDSDIFADRLQCFGGFTNDLEFLLNLVKDLFTSYPNFDKSILIDYIFLNLSPSELHKKYLVGFKCINSLVQQFRENYFSKLVECGYYTKNDKSAIFYVEKKKRDNGKNILVNTLILKNDIPFEYIAKLINKPVSRVKDNVIGWNNKSKFYLYDIQKLRKAYFPQYSLEELAK